MKLLDSRFQCCADLQELFQPISPDLSALQLKGSLEGRLQIFNLGSFRLSLLETNQALFLSGTRRSEPCTIASSATHKLLTPLRPGKDMPWPGLMGYNHQLGDFDLRLAANTALASVIISKEHLHERHQQRKAGDLPLERWEDSNQLELCEPIRTQLRKQLRDLIDNQINVHITKATNQLIDSLFQGNQNAHVADGQADAMPQQSNSCTGGNPSKNLTITELSEVLYQSRTSLFNGCQDHLTPTELQRSIRLDLVRQNAAMQGLGAIAVHMGFTSRSHFARRYEQQYNELHLKARQHD